MIIGGVHMGIGLKDIIKDDKDSLIEDKQKKTIKALVATGVVLLIMIIVVVALIFLNIINSRREERVRLIAKDVMNISNVVKTIGNQYITNTYDGLLVGTSLENNPQEINVNGKIIQYRYGYYYLTPAEVAQLITSLNYKDESYFVNYITGDVVNLKGVKAKNGRVYYSLEDITAIDAGLNPANIYYIHNAEEMKLLHQYPNGSFYLSENIDMGYYGTGEGWTPVASFSGTFDGRGYTITNLTIARPTTMYCGLFGQATSTAVIKNVNFERAKIRGGEHTGVLAGFCSGNISNIEITNSEIDSQAESVGALVGSYDKGTVMDCIVKGTSISANGSIGGLIGTLYSGTVQRNGVDALILVDYRGEETIIDTNIVGIRSVGGLIGEIKANALTDMKENYANARITGTTETGGLIGDVQLISRNTFRLTDSYSEGSISGGIENVGGCIGNIYAVNNPEIEIQSVYTATDTPSTASVRGGFIGKTNIVEGTSAQVLKCCFEKDPLLDLNVVDIGSKAGGVSLVINSKTPAEMKNRVTYSDWNFDLWTLEEGVKRPYLKWQDENYEAQIIEEK